VIGRALILAALIVATAANAQAPEPAFVPRPAAKASPQISAYCLPVSAGFIESDAKASDEMKKCSRGDTIVIPARNPGAVARMCDFSKAIVAIADNVVCVMVFPERGSK
jgi:hypothetical protein